MRRPARRPEHPGNDRYHWNNHRHYGYHRHVHHGNDGHHHRYDDWYDRYTGTNTTGTADISGTTTTGDTTFARDRKNGFGGGADLYGASAADTLRGTPYADFLQGGRGKDRMIGGAGKDYIDGVDSKAANDTLEDGLGTDHCAADEGDAFKGCEGHVVKVGVPSATSSPKEAGHQE